MNAGWKKTVHFGSGKPGAEIVEFAERRAKELNLLNSKGEPNLSGYVILLIKKDRDAATRKKSAKHP